MLLLLMQDISDHSDVLPSYTVLPVLEAPLTKREDWVASGLSGVYRFQLVAFLGSAPGFPWLSSDNISFRLPS